MSSVRIIEAFARAAANYDNYADVQVLAADRLAAYSEANTRDLVEGPILEVGCGTGLFTRRLLDLFVDRKFEITDLCPEMLDKCRARLAIMNAPQLSSIKFAIRDAAQQPEPSNVYALIVAAFALQWMEDLQAALTVLTSQLQPGGKLFFSLPANGCFPEWKSVCRKAGVPFTGNELPCAADFRQFAAENQLRLSLYEESFKVSYRSMYDFMAGLKSIGANTALQAHQLSVAEMRRLLDFAEDSHPDNFDVTYSVLFGNFTRVK